MIGTIIEFILLLIAHASAGIYSANLKYSKKTIYIIWSTWVVLQTAILFYAEFVLTGVVPMFLAGFILPLITQYVIFIATTKGIVTKIIFAMLTYSLFFCIAMDLFTMIKGTFGELPRILILLIQAALLFVVVGYFLRYVCPLCRTSTNNSTTAWIPLISVNIVFILTIILSSIFPTKLTSFTDPELITFALLSVSILAVYPVIFSNINSMSEAAMKREVEAQNKLLLAQIEAENIQLAADSHARHDRRHHNLIMLEYANNNDLESIKKYLGDLMESDNEVWGEVRYCENMTINTVLAIYERRAKEKDISVKIAAMGSRNLNVLPQDLVIVIANLFENAINATAKLKSGDKCIDILIKESARRLVIKVENPCRANLTFDENDYGIGIRSVIATTTKYEGMYDFTAEGGIFSAKTLLNLE